MSDMIVEAVVFPPAAQLLVLSASHASSTPGSGLAFATVQRVTLTVAPDAQLVFDQLPEASPRRACSLGLRDCRLPRLARRGRDLRREGERGRGGEQHG